MKSLPKEFQSRASGEGAESCPISVMGEESVLSWKRRSSTKEATTVQESTKSNVHSVFLRANSVLLLLEDSSNKPWTRRTPFFIWWNLQISTFGESARSLSKGRSRKAVIKGDVQAKPSAWGRQHGGWCGRQYSPRYGDKGVVQELGSQSHTSDIDVKMHMTVPLLPLLCVIFAITLVHPKCQKAPWDTRFFQNAVSKHSPGRACHFSALGARKWS